MMARTMACRRDVRGLAAVELALLLPIYLIVMTGTAEMGRALYEYNTLTKAVRDGAQYVARYGTAAGIFPSNMSAAEGIARNLVVYGSPASTGPKLLTDMDPNDITFAYSPATPRTYVQVTATYEFQPLFGILPVGTLFTAQIRMKGLNL